MLRVWKKWRIKQQVSTFITDIKRRLIKYGAVIISPQDEDDAYGWEIKRDEQLNIIFTIEEQWDYTDTIEEFITKCLLEHELIIILFKNYTGEFLGEHEILELWGFKLLLIDKKVKTDCISHSELFEFCAEIKTNNTHYVHPNPIHIYCGPDGKIIGKDLI